MAVRVPVTLRSLATDREPWIVVGEDMRRGVVRLREEMVATLSSLAERRPSEIRLAKVWMVLAVVKRLGSVRVK